MKRLLLGAGVLCALLSFGFVVLHCGGESTDIVCSYDDDCPQDQKCIDGECVGAEICDPPCKPEVEICFDGECRPIGDPTDKDGDGAVASQDCNDSDWTIHPGAHEYCDGVDNNCDSMVDEGCPACTDGETQPCGTDVGECTNGVQTCEGGSWQPCDNVILPMEERCDGKDNDCDGEVDEICPCNDGDSHPCGWGEGECTEGTQLCEGGVWSGCRNGDLPGPEACDGLDNDCDGVTDDGFMIGASCDGAGECGEGVLECSAATLTAVCSTEPGGSQDESSAETCDGLDNNCDGSIDEGLESQTEDCDGQDNDCDGLTDVDFMDNGEICGNCGECDPATGGCKGNDASCTGNCVVCSGSGISFNCAANNDVCAGDCDYCTGSGTVFDCAPDDNLCGTCHLCEGAEASFSCTAKDSTWGEDLYGCVGSDKRCDLGICDTCGGYVFDDGCGGCAGQGGMACWHYGLNGENCTTVCAAHGGCVEADWNDDATCSVLRHFDVCDHCLTDDMIPATPAHMYADPPWTPNDHNCFYRSGGTQSCGASEVPPEGIFHNRACVCSR